MKDPEPQPPKFISLGESEYNGRKFYGTGIGCNGHADQRAELNYLRDWQAWALRRLKIFEAFKRTVDEALNRR